ncbi:MAG: hypothetical protein V1793_00945 [Pseudomonadota bacterium]
MADKKIQVDVLTLDSVQCAACGYMMESMAAMPQEVQEIIDYKEWSVKTKEGVAKFTAMKGKVLPTICIEGDIVFPSIIPQYEELIDAMAARAKTPELVAKLKAARDKGFEFGNVEKNLQKAGAGQHTRIDSREE